MPTREERIAIFKELAASFPEEAIESTKASVTRKGYDTTGIKYQFVANRMNEILGVGGWRLMQTTSCKEVSRGDKKAYEALSEIRVTLGEWSEGKWYEWADAVAYGGHTSNNEADARKGALTNGFKKAAAFLGAGWQAYAGALDDDNIPNDYDPPEPKAEPKPAQAKSKPAASSAQTKGDDLTAKLKKEFADAGIPVKTASAKPSAIRQEYEALVKDVDTFAGEQNRDALLDLFIPERKTAKSEDEKREVVKKLYSLRDYVTDWHQQQWKNQPPSIETRMAFPLPAFLSWVNDGQQKARSA